MRVVHERIIINVFDFEYVALKHFGFSNLTRVFEFFMWGSYPDSLRYDGGSIRRSSHVPDIMDGGSPGDLIHDWKLEKSPFDHYK